MSISDIRPRNDQGPIAFWFWNGELSASELRRQLRLMRESDIYEFVMHARKGFAGPARERMTPYLSESWFEACRVTIEEAAATGMKAWLYDEVNWPSGSCGGLVTTEAGLVEHFVDADGTLKPFDRNGFKALSPDYLSSEAVRLFIERTHEEYRRRFARYFGTTVVGVFNDEVRFATATPWSPELPDPGAYSIAERLRIAGKRFREVHLKALSDWCQTNGLKLLGHVMGEESLGSQVRYLGGSLASMLSYYHVPGIDHLGDKAEGLHPTYLAAAAFAMGEPTTFSETGAALPWKFTEQDLRRVTGWVAAHGVHRQVLHGFFYEENPSDWPPDMFFRWRHWGDMKRYAGWLRWVQAIRDSLQPEYHVAVYLPVEEFIDDYRPNLAFTLMYEHSDPIAGQQALRHHRAMQALPNALRKHNINFVFVTRGALSIAREMLLLVPSGCDVAFDGRTLTVGDGDYDAVADELFSRLPDLPRITGHNSSPTPLDVRSDIADPYVHTERDEGGVVLKSYRGADDGRVLALWNANGTDFEGAVETAIESSWIVTRLDADGLHQIRHAAGRRVEIGIAPYSYLYLEEQPEAD